MKENLKMMVMKDMELKFFQMGKNMMENFIEAIYTEKEHGIFLMEAALKEIGIMEIKMEISKEYQKTEKFLMLNTKII